MSDEAKVLNDVVSKYIEQLEKQRLEDRKERSRARRPTYVRWGVSALGLLLVFYTATGIGHKADKAITIVEKIVDMVPVARKATYKNDVWEGTATILVVPVLGTISGDPVEHSAPTSPLSMFSGTVENSVQAVKRALEEASATKNLAELVFFIKSPGGEVTPTDEIYSMIKRWRKHHPMVSVSAYFYALAASGGYYIAMSADTVVAQPTSAVGSISVIMQVLNLSEIAKRFGVKMETIKSGELKDLGNMFRDMTGAERAVLIDMIQHAHKRFVDVVHAGRPQLERAQVEKLADGRIFAAPDALKHGLIDATSPTFEAFMEDRAKGIMERLKVGRVHVMYPTQMKSIPEIVIQPNQ